MSVGRMGRVRVAGVVIAVGGVLAALGSAAPAAFAESCQTGHVTFTSKGEEQCYVVPVGVTKVSVRAVGGLGGEGLYFVSGGFGAVVSGVLPVRPGSTLYVEVASNGCKRCGGNSFGGGAGAGGDAASGGGASDVRELPLEDGAASLHSRLLVAGGGGGAGSPSEYSFGGPGGGAEASGEGGAGGNGENASGEAQGGEGGRGGTADEGGQGGKGGYGSARTGNAGGSGVPGTGGSGGGASEAAGGGGGGGLYGGGGGGEGGKFENEPFYEEGAGGGGGAGSSYAASSVSEPTIATDTTGTPEVVIAPVIVAECTGNTGTVTLSPGLTGTAVYQGVKVKGTLTGCTGEAFTEAKYTASLTTTSKVTCSALGGPGAASFGSAKYAWTPKTKATSGTLDVPLTETAGVALSGELESGPYSPRSLSGTVSESYTNAAICGVPQGRKGIIKPVTKGTFTGSAVTVYE